MSDRQIEEARRKALDGKPLDAVDVATLMLEHNWELAHAGNGHLLFIRIDGVRLEKFLTDRTLVDVTRCLRALGRNR